MAYDSFFAKFNLMNINLILAIVAGLLLVVGFLGTFVPVLPGAPLAWLGLLAAFFSEYCKISIAGLIITGIIAVAVSILDNHPPRVGGNALSGRLLRFDDEEIRWK